MSERIDCSGSVYSDDIASWTTAKETGDNAPGMWLPLYLGERQIGEVRMDYYPGVGSWRIDLRGTEEVLAVRDPLDKPPQRCNQ